MTFSTCIENWIKMKLISLFIIFSLISSSLSMGVVLDTVNILKDTVDMTQLEEIVSFLDGISPLYNLDQQISPEEFWKTSETCKNQVDLLLEGIRNTDLWALKMLDASAKLEAGIFYGNHFIFGNYDECIEIKHMYNDDNTKDVIKGQYCTAAVLYTGSRGNLLHKNNQTARQLQVLLQSSVGLCVPSGCSIADLQNISQAISESSLSNIKIIFTDGFCSTEDSKIEIPSRSFVCLFVFATIGSLLVAGTLFDIFNLPGNKGFLKCFSIYTNGKKLFTVKSNEDNLHCLNGLRVLSMMFVVLGHRLIAAGTIPAVNKIFIKLWVDYWYNYFFIGVGFVVDTFFTISGLLIVFLYKRAIERGDNVNWFMFILHRFLRLTPSLAMLVLFYATMLPFFEPAWSPVLEGILGEACRKYWWTTLLYIQNYWNPSEICAVHTWYLAVDTQLYVLAPILLITIKKFPRTTIIAVLLLAFLSMTIAFEVTWRNSLGATYLKQGVDEYENLYTPTHIRIVPWLFGAITGYFIAENKTLPMRKIFVYFLWLFSLGSLVFVLLVQKFFNDHEYHVLYSSLFNTFSRPLWGLAICIIILLCVYNHGGIVGWLLSAPPFNVLIRINYSIYLIHSLVTSIILTKMRTTIYLSVFSIVHDTLGDYCIVLVIATFWTLAFESPFIALEKLLFSKGQYEREEKNYQLNGSSETIIVK